MLADDGSEIAGGSPRFEAAWERYMIAEQRALVASTEGILARSLGKALPGSHRRSSTGQGGSSSNLGCMSQWNIPLF